MGINSQTKVKKCIHIFTFFSVCVCVYDCVYHSIFLQNLQTKCEKPTLIAPTDLYGAKGPNLYTHKKHHSVSMIVIQENPIEERLKESILEE